jgi:hypothetical protein
MSNPGSRGRKDVIVAALIGSMLTSGCVRTSTYQAARFEPTGEALPTTQSVRTAAVWKVKVRERGEKEYHGVDGTERWLQQGDVVGFRKGDDGVIYAVVNREQIPLALNDDHKRVAWHAKTKKTTNFGNGVGDVLTFTGQAVFVVGVGALALWALGHPAKDDCNTTNYNKRHRHHD